MAGGDEDALRQRALVDDDSRVQEAQRLSAATNDRDDAPFQSKYEARKLLQTVRNDLVESGESPLAVALLDCLLGCNLIETEESSSGELLIVSSLESIRKHPTVFHAELIHGLNLLGIQWSQRGDSSRARTHLEDAKAVYDAAFSSGDVPHGALALNTQTLFYLAQVYSQLGDTENAAFYCRQTLNRQLDQRQINALEWASNSVKLSAFYISSNRLRQAQYCIDCAIAVKPDGRSEQHLHVEADISCAIGELLARYLHASLELSSGRRRPPAQGEPSSFDQRVDTFDQMDVPLPPPFNVIEHVKDAQAVVRKAMSSLQHALSIYKLDGYVSDHVVILQKLSGLLKDLAAFAGDPSLTCKLYKRRIDTLEPVLLKLNPKVYTDFVRQMSFEIAEACSDMADIKMTQAEALPPTAKAARVKKINHLIAKAIAGFTAFVQSLEGDGEQASVDPAHYRHYLMAKFHIARLTSKAIADSNDARVAGMQRSLDEYASIVRFCDGKARDVSAFRDELAICRDMCALLPIQIQRTTTSSP
ncbi:KIF-binding protein [Plasmodiophora brassicae]|uniref:KIF-binding protein n=1 Tax=Plasmodiophora brassicae TaxID=37360 RepID=A0A3P3YDT0_PLABS|nr:unnamed protein product [Plasmodiophora brassicae]